VLLLGPTSVLAIPVTFVFTGRLSDDGCWARSGPDVCGEELFGYFTIDDAPVVYDDTHAIYAGSGGPYGMYLQIGGQSGWNDTVGLSLYSPHPTFNRDLVYLHTGTSIASGGGGGNPGDTLRFTSFWRAANAFSGVPRFPPMPDPNDFSPCAESDGCVITVGESLVQEFDRIHDWNFFRSPVVIPMPVPEPGTLALFALGALGLGCMSRRRRDPHCL
jgi:hypothetical protein